MELFVNMYRNEVMSVVYHTQKRFQNEIKEFTHATNNEFEAMSVGFVLTQFAKRHITCGVSRKN